MAQTKAPQSATIIVSAPVSEEILRERKAYSRAARSSEENEASIRVSWARKAIASDWDRISAITSRTDGKGRPVYRAAWRGMSESQFQAIKRALKERAGDSMAVEYKTGEDGTTRVLFRKTSKRSAKLAAPMSPEERAAMLAYIAGK